MDVPHAATPTPAADHTEVIDSVTEQLFRSYVIVNSKISTNSVNAAIELVAERGGGNAQFRETVLEEFEKSCEDKNSMRRPSQPLEIDEKDARHGGVVALAL